MDELAWLADRFWPQRWSLVTETSIMDGRRRHRAAIAWTDGRIPLEAWAATGAAARRGLAAALGRLDAERPVGRLRGREPVRARLPGEGAGKLRRRTTTGRRRAAA